MTSGRGDGVLTATPGASVDYEAVRQVLQAWAAEFDVQMVAYDPWNATDLVSRLEQQDGFVCVPMRQGFASLSAPTKSLEKAVLGAAAAARRASGAALERVATSRSKATRPGT